MRERGEHLGDHGTLMPRRPVGHEHDPRVLRRRIGAGDIPEVPGKPLLPGALFRGRPPPGLLRALDQACGEPAGHQIQRAKNVQDIVTVQIAHEGAVSFHAEGGTERRDHGTARLILTQQDQSAHLGFF